MTNNMFEVKFEVISLNLIPNNALIEHFKEY